MKSTASKDFDKTLFWQDSSSDGLSFDRVEIPYTFLLGTGEANMEFNDLCDWSLFTECPVCNSKIVWIHHNFYYHNIPLLGIWTVLTPNSVIGKQNLELPQTHHNHVIFSCLRSDQTNIFLYIQSRSVPAKNLIYFRILTYLSNWALLSNILLSMRIFTMF